MRQNDFAKLKILLQNQSDKNPVILEPEGGSKLTVLHFAARDGRLNIIKGYKDILGIENLNPIDDNGFTPLYWASLKGHLDVAKYYIKNGYKASSKISTLSPGIKVALHLLIYLGSTTVLNARLYSIHPMATNIFNFFFSNTTLHNLLTRN